MTGYIDINRADSLSLQRIIHIGPARAVEVVRLRPFRSFDAVSGIGNARLADIRAQGVACVR